MRRTTLCIAVMGALLAASACTEDPFNAVIQPDGLVIDASPYDGGDGGDGLVDGLDIGTDADACVKDPKGETCNKKDDDCNGKVDDVPATKLATDAKHCGKCFNACSFTNAYAKCVAATCVMDKCAPGYHDANNSSKDGCEYACVTSNSGVEKCDGLDNDCDNKIDEDFKLTTDVKNCGKCGNECYFLNAAASCVAGICTMGSCTSGYADLDKASATGCEYKCPQWPKKSPDSCNNTDDDCDGKIDEDFTSTACGSSKGECTQGKTQCISGTVSCKGGKQPGLEVCNGKDDDCNGTKDDGFDKLNDPRYCENCKGCSTIPNALTQCNSGTCGILACKTGWVDLDKKIANGCEYQCTRTGGEICDGKDNDCDKLIDTADPDMIVPTGSFCIDRGPCKGAKIQCRGTYGWVCNYGKDVELRTCTKDADCLGFAPCVGGKCLGFVTTDETSCDGKDNDCDGKADDTFTTKGKTCQESGKQGVCQGTGTWVCDAKQTGVECKITKPGLTSTDEACDGKDNDCDGKIDEEENDAAGNGVKDDMIRITKRYAGNNYDYWIYKYEASRPDSTNTSAGSKSTRACSKAQVIPWSSVTFDQATAYCKAAGKRLCSPEEWFLACSGAPDTGTNGLAFPYGSTFQKSTCNGSGRVPGKDTVVPTGDLAGCSSHYNVIDMSGNLKEWTFDPSHTSANDPEMVRGGAYDTVEGGLRCDFRFVVMPRTFFYPNLGFRCCSDKAP